MGEPTDPSQQQVSTDTSKDASTADQTQSTTAASENQESAATNMTSVKTENSAAFTAPSDSNTQPDSSAAVSSPSKTPTSATQASATHSQTNASQSGPSEAASSPDTQVSDVGGTKVKSARSHHSKAESIKGEEKKTSSAPSRKKRIKLGELDLSTARIGFIGAGRIAESTINGLIHYAKIQPGRIYVSAPSSKGLERFKALGCRVTKRNYDIFGRYDCDIVFLCFHGFVIKHCYKLGGNRPHPLTTNYIPHQRHPIYILSLVSGVSMSQIKACLLNPDSTSRYTLEMHRIMLNTAVGHGLGICAVDCEPDSKKLSAPIRQLLSSIAQLEHVPASQMDAACAIGGSGLAFSYYFINALADGAFRMGLSRQQAIRFASKTAQCAAQTMLESGKHPAELRDNVSSPSGAAIYGIHVLEKNDVASGVTAAVEAAHKRANDLATQDITT